MNKPQVSSDKLAKRTLTVACNAGLCNRIFALISGLVIAEATERQFRMWWPRSNACAATFGELFMNDWPVEHVDKSLLDNLVCYDGRFTLMPNLLEVNTHDVVILTYTSLLSTKRYSEHQPLVPRCVETFLALKPLSEIQNRIDDFRSAKFRPHMIGVHLRRGDFKSFYPESLANLRSALAATDAFLSDWPEAGILLCTDDGAPNLGGTATHSEGLHNRFYKRYGERVVWTTPSSLDRGSPRAIVDALIDFYLLRNVDALVGTYGSTFSVLAAYGRDIPVVSCTGKRLRTQLERHVLKMTGLGMLLKSMGRRRFGRDLDVIKLRRYYVHRIRALAVSLLKDRAPRIHRAAKALKHAAAKRRSD